VGKEGGREDGRLGFPGFLATHLKDRNPTNKVREENGQIFYGSLFSVHHALNNPILKKGNIGGDVNQGYTTLRGGGPVCELAHPYWYLDKNSQHLPNLLRSRVNISCLDKIKSVSLSPKSNIFLA
jgi:hypothetical protein